MTLAVKILNAKLFLLFVMLCIVPDVDANDSTVFDETDVLLRVYGSIIDNDSNAKLEECVVKVLQNGNFSEFYFTNSRGRYDFLLPSGYDYSFYYEKPGYVSKSIQIDSKQAMNNDDQFIYILKADIALFPELPNIDYSILKNPIGKGYCDDVSGSVVFDENYTKSMTDKVAKLYRPNAENQKPSSVNTLVEIINNTRSDNTLKTSTAAVTESKERKNVSIEDIAGTADVKSVPVETLNVQNTEDTRTISVNSSTDVASPILESDEIVEVVASEEESQVINVPKESDEFKTEISPETLIDNAKAETLVITASDDKTTQEMTQNIHETAEINSNEKINEDVVLKEIEEPIVENEDVQKTVKILDSENVTFDSIEEEEEVIAEPTINTEETVSAVVENEPISQEVMTNKQENISIVPTQINTGIVWRVQLGAFNNKNVAAFYGLSNIDFITGKDGVTRCVAGLFDTPKEAAMHKLNLIEKGYKDAFIIAFKGNDRIDINKTGADLKKVSYQKLKNEMDSIKTN